MRVFVTGASGFVGQSLVSALTKAGHLVVCAEHRGTSGEVALDLARRPVVDPAALTGIETVVHLAGLAHAGPKQAHTAWTINTDGTQDLARLASQAGVGHFLFVSTAQVHGQVTAARPIRENDPFAPQGPYAASKAAAEQALNDPKVRGDMTLTVVRPPLVVGFGGAGNVRQLATAARFGLPVPSGLRYNARSVIARANLAAWLVRMVAQPGVGTSAYLVRERCDVSTYELYRTLAHLQNRSPWTLPVGRRPLRAALGLCGQTGLIRGLLDNFQIDDRAVRNVYGSRPDLSLKEALASEL